MKNRTTNGNTESGRHYINRGITVCEEWTNSFQAFYDHIGPRPSPSHTIDRIDNDRGYEPGNVRWATYTEQNRNRSNTDMVTFRGETKPVKEWCEITGIPYAVVYQRLKLLNWSPENALTMEPSWRKPQYTKEERAIRNRVSQRIYKAIQKGRLVKPEACCKCGSPHDRLEFFPYRGMEAALELDVEWVCPTCNRPEALGMIKRRT